MVSLLPGFQTHTNEKTIVFLIFHSTANSQTSLSKSFRRAQLMDGVAPMPKNGKSSYIDIAKACMINPAETSFRRNAPKNHVSDAREHLHVCKMYLMYFGMSNKNVLKPRLLGFHSGTRQDQNLTKWRGGNPAPRDRQATCVTGFMRNVGNQFLTMRGCGDLDPSHRQGSITHEKGSSSYIRNGARWGGGGNLDHPHRQDFTRSPVFDTASR